MSIMLFLLKIILITYCGSHTFAYRRNLVDYWIDVLKDNREAYRQNGRTCEECHFPFSHQGVLHYGCRPYEGLEHACKNSSGVFIECPSKCPLGTAYFSKIAATNSDDGNFVNLACEGWASPKPNITWMKDGEVIAVEEPPEDQYPTIASTSTTLVNDPSDYGVYSCSIRNEYSSASSNGSRWLGSYYFTGQVLPSAPTNLKLISQIRTYVTLAWDYDEEVPSSYRYQTSYTIRMTPGKPQGKEKRDFSFRRVKNITIKHLEPGVKYEFKVKRFNKHGSGPYSAPLYVTIPEDAVLDRPVNLTVVHVNSTSVSLKWDIDGEMKDYDPRVVHTTPGLNGKNQSSIRIFQERSKTINGLIPLTKYAFEVEVFISEIYPRRTKPVYVTTLPQAASIKSLQVHDDDHNVVEVKCKVAGGPPPQIIWKKDKQPITDDNLFNTTISDGMVISILTLPRNAFVYTEYSCEASNSGGNATSTTIVKYNGNHPLVSLERMMTELSEDIKKIKEDVETIRSYHEYRK